MTTKLRNKEASHEKSCDVYERLNLSHVETLQETGTHRVELVQDPDGRRLVLKTYTDASRFLKIELAVLRSLGDSTFEFLRIPELVATGDDYVVMSFVDRAYHTRDTISLREWTEGDVTLFCSALREFQQLAIDARLFTLKQRVMGLIYPVVRLALAFPAGLRVGALRLSDLPRLTSIVICYVISRLTFRNVLTHYDLSTLNYAFTPDHRMSMLDFEFAYYLGDPMFDAIYHVTIPPIAIADWTFQSDIVAQQARAAGGGLLVWNRIRLLLIVCLLCRCLFFANDSPEQSIMRRSVRTLLSRDFFTAWTTRIMESSLRQPTPDALVA